MTGLRSRKPPADSPLYQTLYTGGQQTAVNGRQTPLYDPKGKGKAVANGDTHDFLALDMAGSGGATSGDLQQMQLVEQEVSISIRVPVILHVFYKAALIYLVSRINTLIQDPQQ